MKKHKVCAILYLISGILFAVIAVMDFINGNNNTLGFIYTGLSVSWLGISLNNFKKYKKGKK